MRNRKQLTEVCNDVFTTEQQQLTMYEVNLLIELFKKLKKDGITAIGFSLLIDLVNERAAK
jgi:flagellar motor component MotA